MTRKKPELPEWDDGRTIANMNVEGMPWYSPHKRLSRAERREARKDQEPVLTKQEARYYTWGALKAALAVTLVLCGGIVLFVLFCLHVWFQ